MGFQIIPSVRRPLQEAPRHKAKDSRVRFLATTWRRCYADDVRSFTNEQLNSQALTHVVFLLDRHRSRRESRLGNSVTVGQSSLLAALLGLVAHTAAAASYWQIQQPSVTAIVEGNRETAAAVATMTLRMQSAARWLLGWPDDHREPPVLVFEVNERLIRQTFKPPPSHPGAYSDATTGHEIWARTPALVIVTAPLSYERGHELRSFQHAYGEALMRAEASHDWPSCVHQGMAQLFSVAELTPPNHFYMTGQAIAGQQHLWDPARILLPVDGPHEPMPQWTADERGYSCFLFAFMIASAAQDQRIALSGMLTAVGRGTALEQATQSELQQTLPEFTARYRDFARAVQFVANAPPSPNSVSSLPLKAHEIRVDFPQEIPPMPDAVPISAENVQALMRKVCDKLGNCRK